MNILDIQDNLKNFSEDQLINEMQMPSGTAPQFLVLGEIKRRKKMRDELSARQAQNMPTVAEEAINAAGMPQEGLAQMAQAMAPKSSIAQNTGIGSLQQMPMEAPPAGAEMGMAEIMPEMMPQGMPQGMPPAMPMASGGVLRAQQGMYMPEDPRLRALMMQESRGDPMATGSVGEIGAFQIRPETALMPGYGIKSLFPQISSEIGAGKKYRTPAEAYEANKDLIDSTLRDTQKAEGFASDYLTRAEERLGSPEAALLSYNRGISGARKVDDPTQDPYYQGVMSFMGDDGLPSVLADRGVTAADLAQPDSEAGMFSAMAASGDMTNAANRSGEKFGERDQYEKEQDEKTQFILGAIKSAMNPMAIRGLAEQYYGQGNAAIDAALIERGFNPPAMNESGMSVGDETVVEAETFQETKPEYTSTATPQEITETEVETETTDTTTGDTATTPPEAGAPAQSSGDDIAAQLAKMMTFSGGDSSSGVEQEIIDLQKDLAKSREQDKWLALGQAGLALMSSTNPTLLGAVGEAGLAGVKSLKDADESYREGVIDLINARSKLSKGALTAEEAAPLLSDVLETLGETVEDKNPASPTFGEMIPKVTGTSRLELENLRDYLMPKVGYPSATQRSIQSAISATNNAS